MMYILTMQESVALLMGDAYARATKKPALVQIHSTPGLGNAIGAMYQAYRGHAPLVVIGGDAGLKYVPMEAQMYGDLVAFAEPVTKWSTMVLDQHSLLRTLRRAIKIAATPPMGPVYICLPICSICHAWKRSSRHRFLRRAACRMTTGSHRWRRCSPTRRRR